MSPYIIEARRTRKRPPLRRGAAVAVILIIAVALASAAAGAF